VTSEGADVFLQMFGNWESSRIACFDGVLHLKASCV
jgi:hypothetical protein